jgi:hypothetical protein
MPLTVPAGTTVNAVIDGHSSTNGAPIPDSATVALTSSDTTIATVPASVPVPAGGTPELVVPVTLTGTAGSTSVSVVVTVGAQTFNAADQLTVTAVVAALDHVTLTLTQV